MLDFFLYATEKALLLSSQSIHTIRLNQRTIISKYLSSKKTIKLDLGSGGTKKKGFIGIDAVLGPGVDIEHNLEEGIPFSDNSVGEIYASHFLEHVQNRKVPFVLKECARVLKPKGKVTIEVPDLEKSLDEFLKMSEKDKWERGWETIFGNQKKEFEFHKTGFTPTRLIRLFENSGFVKVLISRYNFGNIRSLRVKALKPKT